MNNKFLVLTNIYDCTGYFIGFTFLENVVLLPFASHLLVFVRKLMFFKYSCQRPWKEKYGRPAFLEEFQAAIIFQRFPCILTKFLIF